MSFNFVSLKLFFHEVGGGDRFEKSSGNDLLFGTCIKKFVKEKLGDRFQIIFSFIA